MELLGIVSAVNANSEADRAGVAVLDAKEVVQTLRNAMQ